MNRIAIIDIGSNSLKLIISDIYDNGFFQISYEKKIKLRLSNYKTRANDITTLGIKKLTSSVEEMKKICTLYKCNRVIAVATEAIRKSRNGKEIIDSLKESLNLDIKIIDGKQEAYYGFISSVNSINLNDFLQIDIGGSSAEIVLVKNKKLIESVSLPYGSIPNTNNFNLINEVSKKDEQKFKETIFKEFDKYPWIRENKNLPVVGIGGSVRCIEKILRNHSFDDIDILLDNFIISYKNINSLFNIMKKLNFEQKKAIRGMSSNRADIFVGCLILIKYLMFYINSDKLAISKFGIREGILFKYTENLFETVN
ncbi:Ppx/GppA phosphatase family protein [Intestinibacter sp.]